MSDWLVHERSLCLAAFSLTWNRNRSYYWTIRRDDFFHCFVTAPPRVADGICSINWSITFAGQTQTYIWRTYYRHECEFHQLVAVARVFDRLTSYIDECRSPLPKKIRFNTLKTSWLHYEDYKDHSTIMPLTPPLPARTTPLSGDSDYYAKYSGPPRYILPELEDDSSGAERDY